MDFAVNVKQIHLKLVNEIQLKWVYGKNFSVIYKILIIKDIVITINLSCYKMSSFWLNVIYLKLLDQADLTWA